MKKESHIPAPFELRLFGAFEAFVDGQRVRRPRSHAGQWLLTLLVLRQDYPVERAHLASLLWPDSGHEQALFNLRRNLTDLRQLLGREADRLVAPTPRTLHLNLEGANCDLKEFDALRRRTDSEALRAAIALYRGPLFEGCAEDWAELERAAREQGYLSALETLAANTLREGNPSEALGFLKKVLVTEPYRETALRSLLQTLAAAGDFSAAILAYREFRLLLQRELQTEPDPETQAVYHQARRLAKDSPLRSLPHSLEEKRTAPFVSPSVSLPLPLSRLVGREEEIRQVRNCLGQSRLVTLTGAGGAGKTRLAIAAAREMAGDFADGIQFVDLSPLAESSLTPFAIARSLRLPEEPGRSPLDALMRYLASQEMLLILDNCEHLLEGCASLAYALLQASPCLHLLITSRQALGMSGEIVWRVPSLAFPGENEISQENANNFSDSLQRFDALRLFAERAREAFPFFVFSQHNSAIVARICRRLDGIPLAIELAAARVRSLPIEEIDARLATNFRLLKGGAGLLPRHETLAATFAWSWNLLASSERVLLERLSVFAGGWSLAAAEAVCAGDGIAKEQVVDLLTALADKSLVVYLLAEAPNDGSPGESRYRFLETTRQFAAERREESGASETAHNRHSDYFLTWAEEIKPKLWREEQTFWFGRMEVEHNNFRAALEWRRKRDDIEKEFRLAVALSRFWDTHGHLSEGRARLEAALTGRTNDLPAMLHIDARIHAGWMAHAQGDNAVSCAHYEKALAICRQMGYEDKIPSLLNFLGCAYQDAGDPIKAHTSLEESRLLFLQRGKSGALAAALSNEGTLLLRQGDLTTAQTYLTEAVALCRELGAHQLLGAALHNLAVAAFRQGRYQEAIRHNASGLHLWREGGALINIPDALGLMAVCMGPFAQWERIARLLGVAQQFREALGVPPEISLTPDLAEVEAAARKALGEKAYTALFAAGTTMDRERAVAYALEAEILSP